MDESMTTLDKEAEEVAEMIRAATTSLMPSTRAKQMSIEKTEGELSGIDNQAARKGGSNTQHEKIEIGETNDSEESFRSALESFFRSVLGSCGGVLEVASFFVKSSWKPTAAGNAYDRMGVSGSADVSKPRGIGHSFWPTDEKRRRSIFYISHSNNYGFVQSQEMPPPFRTNEDGEHCLDISAQNFDDNISAISAHTLEEMALQNHTFRSEPLHMSPPPITPVSSSSSSSQHRSNNSPTHPSQLDSIGCVRKAFVLKRGQLETTSKVSDDAEAELDNLKFLPPRIPARRFLEV